MAMPFSRHSKARQMKKDLTQAHAEISALRKELARGDNVCKIKKAKRNVNVNPVNPVNVDPVNVDPVNVDPVNVDPINATPATSTPATSTQ